MNKIETTWRCGGLTLDLTLGQMDSMGEDGWRVVCRDYGGTFYQREVPDPVAQVAAAEQAEREAHEKPEKPEKTRDWIVDGHEIGAISAAEAAAEAAALYDFDPVSVQLAKDEERAEMGETWFSDQSVVDRHIVVTGNPANGFEFTGPFDSADEAVTEGNAYQDNTGLDWWIAPLQAAQYAD